jgi:hypothetical protein
MGSLTHSLPAFAVWVQRFCCVYYMSCVLLRARMHEALTLIAIYNDRLGSEKESHGPRHNYFRRPHTPDLVTWAL